MNIAKLKAAVEKAKDDFLPNMTISTRDELELIAALEAIEQHAARGWREAHEQAALVEAAEKRIAELEARTLTVRLPEAATEGGQGYRKKVIWVLQESCFDAGINLETGGEA
ncbi:hypothetical protein ACI08I_000326 [Cronobacter malonaticus]